MIKVNLAQVLEPESAEVREFAFVSQETSKVLEPTVKIGSIFLFVAVLYFYEGYIINQKQSILNQIRRQRQEIKDKVEENKTITQAVQDLMKEKKNISKQIGVIQKISEKKAFKLQAITAVQEAMPVNIWLEEIEINKNKMKFLGYSMVSTDIEKIVKKLSDLPFTSSVLNKDLKREKIGKKDVYSFNIEGVVQI